MLNNIVNIALVVFSVLFSLIIIEVLYRGYLYYSKTFDIEYFYFVQGEPWLRRGIPEYLFPPNSVRDYLMYDREGNRVLSSRLRINRSGFRSEFEYSINKKPNEIRIAVIGDSFTVGSSSNISWVDELQKVINKTNTNKNYSFVTTLNIGQPGASVSRMVSNYYKFAQIFQPDVIIANIIDSDLLRHQLSDEKLDKLQFTEAVNEKWQRKIEAPDFIIDEKVSFGEGMSPPLTKTLNSIKIHMSCPPGIKDVEHDQCFPHASFYLDPGVVPTGEDIKALGPWMIKKIMRRLWLSPYPLSIFAAMGYTPTLNYTTLLGQFRQFEQKLWVPFDIQINEDKRTEKAGETPGRHFDKIRRSARAMHILNNEESLLFVIYNPQAAHLISNSKDRGMKEFKRLLNNIQIVDMRTYLEPFFEGKEKHVEAATWFNLPYDGHWSDKGARIYAKAVAKFVFEKILKKNSSIREPEPHRSPG